MRPTLGTYVEIGAAGSGTAAQCAINEAFAVIQTVHAALSFQHPDSELSRLNRHPGQWVAVSRIALQVLKLARVIGLASGERFNCTVGGQMVRWGALPDHTGNERIEVGTAQDIEFRRGAVRLRRAVLVTLDGIAKGFAVDRAIATLRRHGVTSGWVNAGGDLRVYGDRRLDLVRREEDGGLRKIGCLQNGAMASSFAGSQREEYLPGRIVGATAQRGDPHSVVSVLADNAWRADALTKVAAVTPAAERAALVAGLGGTLITDGTC
jgi:thiamine biosynthesis lipoprotein